MARTAKEGGGYIGRNVKTWMYNGDEEMTKWSQQKSDQPYNVADFYDREAAKALNQLYEIISSSDVGLEVPVNWRSFVKLRPPFLKFL